MSMDRLCEIDPYYPQRNDQTENKTPLGYIHWNGV